MARKELIAAHRNYTRIHGTTPTKILASQEFFEEYESELTPTTRWVDGHIKEPNIKESPLSVPVIYDNTLKNRDFKLVGEKK